MRMVSYDATKTEFAVHKQTSMINYYEVIVKTEKKTRVYRCCKQSLKDLRKRIDELLEED